jgi:uncharacterized RDD family membrane protein YckC
MTTKEMYDIAAHTQRTPGFGYFADGEAIPHRQLRYATILSRFCAWFIDGIVTAISLVLIVIGLAIMDHLTGGDPREFSRGSTMVIVAAASLAFLWLYYVAQETSVVQATLGKRLMGIKVATLSGDRIGIGKSTIRFMTKVVPGVNPLLGLVCFLADVICLAFNSAQNRTVHDLIAGTVVIND